MGNLTDVFATVTVPKTEYEDLIRESEQNNIIRELMKKDGYITSNTLKVILCVENPEEEKKSTMTFAEMLGGEEGNNNESI